VNQTRPIRALAALCVSLVFVSGGAHAAGEKVPPTVTFDTQQDQMLMAPPVGQDRITGTVSDDSSGVKEIVIIAVWRPTDVITLSITQTNPVNLKCDAARLSCTWSTTVPNFVPGYWQISAKATDLNKNVANVVGPRVLVIVPTTS
jgi:hypothetical protein